MDSLKAMDRFLEKSNLPRLNQEEIEIMNKPITSTEIETMIKKKKTPQKTKVQSQMASQVNSIKHLEKKSNPYPSKTLPNSCRGRNTSKHLWGQNHRHTKTWQRKYKKRKL